MAGLDFDSGLQPPPRPVPDDLVQPFQIEGRPVRGRLVRLGPVVDEVIERHDYPEPVATLLAEMVALAAVLSGALKYDGVFTLQTKGDGPVRLMVADVTSAGEVRGYAQFDATRLAALAQRPAAAAPVPRLVGAGYLAFTVDQGAHTERYQGIVELEGATLVDCVHHYFRQSEQLQAGIKLAVGREARADGSSRWRAGALMMQRMPEGGLPPLADDAAEEDWRRALTLMASSTSAELLDPGLPPNELLYRLFHEEGVRVFRPGSLKAACRCSRERVERVLRSLPRAEIEELTTDDGLVVVTCEFCNRAYSLAEADLDALYGGA